jgi:diguanylate cyclase (GGDEF)-like protein/PAS domain S-box-containing protein
VSSQKDFDQLLKESENALVRANDANQALLETLSHDLRTPLNTILGFADMMDQQVFGPINNVHYRSYTEDICKSGRSMLEIMDDVLERKRFEKIEKQGKDFRQIIELAPDLIGICRSDEFQLINPAGANMLGMWPVDTLVGRKFNDFVHPDFKHILADGLDKLIAEQTRTPLCLRRADGVEIDIELAVIPYQGDDEEIDSSAIMVMARDVSERNRAVKHLAAREEYIRSVIDSVDDGIVAIDETGMIETVNPAIETIFGYDRGELIDQAASKLLIIEDNPFANESLQEYLKTGKSPYIGMRQEVVGKRKDGTSVPIELAISVLNASGRHVFIGAVHDITERNENAARLRHMATHDPLTGMPNRAAFMEYLARAIERADTSETRIAVLLANLDNFKNINDGLGHDVGDKLLIEAGKRMEGGVGGSGYVTHLGGDSYGIIVETAHTEEDARALATKVLNLIAAPFTVDGKEIFMSASIGIGLYPIIADDHTDLMRKVDSAVFHAKDLGRANFQFYTSELSSNIKRRLEIEAGLRRALETDEFQVFYQAKVDLDKRQITGAEALLRWISPELGFVSPEEFIPVAEATGLIVSIGNWVLRTACAQAVEWEKYCDHPVQVAVNLSAMQFLQGDLINDVKDCLKDTGLPANQLDLELTESMLVENPERTIETLRQFKELGISISMDDFGTGYSSLSYLTKFPLDTLKVDRAFVMNLPDDPDAVAIASAIVSMAKQLHLHIVAEGIETGEQVEFLHQLGCHIGQGYLFSKPIPADEFNDILSRGDAVFTAA